MRLFYFALLTFLVLIESKTRPPAGSQPKATREEDEQEEGSSNDASAGSTEVHLMVGNKEAVFEGLLFCDPLSHEALVLHNQACLCQDEGAKVMIDQVYVLNPDHRHDRLMQLHQHFTMAQFRGLRYTHRDWRAFQTFEVEWYNSKAYRPLARFKISQLLSHMSVWMAMIQRGYQRIWVMEDGTHIEIDEDGSGNLKHLPEVLQQLDTIDPDWMWLYTGRRTSADCRSQLQEDGLLEKWTVGEDEVLWTSDVVRVPEPLKIVKPGLSGGLYGYILTLKGAHYLLGALTELGIVYDLDIALHLPEVREGLHMYALDPELTTFIKDDPDLLVGQEEIHHKLLSAHQLYANGEVDQAIPLYLRVLELESIRMKQGERPDLAHIVSANQALGLLAADDQEEVAEQYLWQAVMYAQYLPTHKPALYRNICSFWFRSGQTDKERSMCVDGVLDESTDVRMKLASMMPSTNT